MMERSTKLAARARRHLLCSAEVQTAVARECLPAILIAANRIAEAMRGGGKLLLCGNGGSAADCQHLAAEFVSRYSRQLERPALAAIALTANTSVLTAHANDFAFEEVFARQVQALGRPGDVLLAISTSGRSANVLRAVAAARTLALATIGLTGRSGPLASEVDCAVVVPSGQTQHIQEALLTVEHVLCDLVEQILFGA